MWEHPPAAVTVNQRRVVVSHQYENRTKEGGRVPGCRFLCSGRGYEAMGRTGLKQPKQLRTIVLLYKVTGNRKNPGRSPNGGLLSVHAAPISSAAGSQSIGIVSVNPGSLETS